MEVNEIVDEGMTEKYLLKESRNDDAGNQVSKESS